MKLYDPVFGEYIVPDNILQLLKTPIVQRLRWIRLSNIPSLNYPMIADISRYAHSVGVCVLADRLSHSLRLNDDEKKVLMCAALLHDAGIPPMGHLMEEALVEAGIAFDHEESLRIILLDEARRFETMPDGKKNGVIDALRKIGVSGKVVFETIKGDGSLGKYITSNIDLDNIDNVIRIYISIFGYNNGGYDSTKMAIGYFNASKEEHEELWNKTRACVYHMLMFSLEDFSQKATMKRLLRIYLSNKIADSNVRDVVREIQFLSDDEMLVVLSTYLKSNKKFAHFWSGEYDRIVSYGWINSVEKKSLLDFRKEISAQFSDHYIDFIPDKRIKFSSRAAQPDQGAFIGIFSTSNSVKSKKYDDIVISTAKNLMPQFVENKIPDNPVKTNSQLNLF